MQKREIAGFHWKNNLDILKMQNSSSLVGMEARFLFLKVIRKEFWVHTEGTTARDVPLRKRRSSVIPEKL